MRFKLIFTLLLTLSGTALARSNPAIEDDVAWEHIQAICLEKWKILPTQEWNGKAETKGFKFALTTRTVATQPRIAAQKIRDSINGVEEEEKKSHIDKNGAVWNHLKHAYDFSEEHPNSLYGETSALDVIAYRGGLYDIDGHHRNIVSFFAGSPFTPVNVIDDWSYEADGKTEVSFEDFAKRMKDAKYAYVRNPRSKPRFSNPCDLADDPNLFFARKLTLNVKYDEDEQKIIKVEGADPFLFVKINRGRPMQEFEIADQMTEAELLWNPRWGRIVPPTAMQKAGRLFKKAHWAENDARVIVFDEPQSMSVSELEKLIRRHRNAACEKKLTDAK